MSTAYANSVASMRENLKGSMIAEELEIKAMSNKAYRKLEEKVNAVLKPTHRQLREDFHFGPVIGKITGLLRTIGQANTFRKELCKITKITEEQVSEYYYTCGNFPFWDGAKKTINYGRQLDETRARELVYQVAATIGYVITDRDLEWIKKETWQEQYDKELKILMDTMALRNAMPQIPDEEEEV